MAEVECMESQPSLLAMKLCEEGILNLKGELDTLSKLVVACYERVQMMHPLSFNTEQCQYLFDKLKEVIDSLSVFFESSWEPMELEKHLLSFKLLLVLAMEIESFIKGCSQHAWVPVAMTLANMSEFVSSVGFHLELCLEALSKRCGTSGGLSLDQVADISKNVNEIVKTKASFDKEDLLKKISLALPSLHGDEKDLASYLLQRLLRVVPIPNIPSKIPKWDLSQYLAFLGSISKKVERGVSIGKGASATVFKAKWLGMEVAIKVFYGKDNPEFQKEVDILARLCHFNITSMFCYTQDRRKCSISMELMDGDLFTLMEQRLKVNHPPFNIWEAVDMIHQIAEGGKYLHEQGIVHRDLKSLNILVKSVKTPGMNMEYIQVKVADFNVSKIKKNSTTNTELTKNIGSNRWMAPELIQLQSFGKQMIVGTNNQSIPKHPHKCDIYSFAMVCYEILTGELPFGDVDDKDPKKMKAMILEGQRPNLPIQCPFELRVLIEKCWNPKPECCPTFADICQELKYVKYVLVAGIASISKSCGGTKGVMDKHADALEDLNEVNELKPNHVMTLWNHGEVKRMMGKYADALEDLNKANELEPNHVKTLWSRGEVKRMMGKYIDALEDLNKASELEPNHVMTLRNRGEVKGMMGKYADALEDLNKFNELEPNHVKTLWSRGEVKRMMGMYADALQDLSKANELEPNHVMTLWSCGEVKRMMGKYVDALEDLNKANELEPNHLMTLHNRGEVKRMMGKYADALEDLSKANELEPNHVTTLWNCGEVKRMMGKYANALEDLNKANELEPNHIRTLWSRGEVKRMMGKYADALEDLNKANELDPNDAVTLRLLGKVKRMMGKYANALEDLNKANELEPNHVMTLWSRGEIKRGMGNYADALKDLNKANELKPNYVRTLWSRGEIKKMMGKYADALEDLKKANELEPNDVGTLRLYGEVKRMMGKYTDALEDLNKANELEPNHARTLWNRGEVKRMMGKYADALEDLSKANELEPNHVTTLWNCGEVKRMMGKYVDALKDLNKSNELEPNHVMTLWSRGEVKRLMDKYVGALEDLN